MAKSKCKLLAKAVMGVLVLISSALLIPGCSPKKSPTSVSNTSQANPNKSTFKIALECAYAPYNWTQTDDSNGAVPIQDSGAYCNGYDIQIAKKVASGINAQLQVYKTEWTAIPTAITSGRVDAGICGMTVTTERKKTLLFSKPYYTSKFVVLVKKGGKYENATNLSELKGAICTSQQSSSWYPLLKQVPSANIQPALADVPTMLVSLNSGKCDLLSCDKPTGMAAVNAYQNIKMIDFDSGKGFKVTDEETQVCAALALNNTELKGKIDKVLDGISENDRVKLMDWAVKNQPSNK
jgi:putative lysine transport system substrate-binding protein